MTAWLYLEPLPSLHHCSLAQSSPSSSFYWWSVSPVNLVMISSINVCYQFGFVREAPPVIQLAYSFGLADTWFHGNFIFGRPSPKIYVTPPLIPHLRSVGKFYLNVQNMVLWDFCDKILLLVQMIIMLVLRQSNAISRLKNLEVDSRGHFFIQKQCPWQKGKP